MPNRAILLVLSALLFSSWSCSSGPAPNQTVIDFLEKDLPDSDTLAILSKLDKEAIVQERKADLLLAGDTARANSYNSDSLVRDLCAGGELNQRWLAHQIIVSRVTQKKDSAQVEVSFIDAVRDVQYYNRMGLYKSKGAWKIYSFKTLK